MSGPERSTLQQQRQVQQQQKQLAALVAEAERRGVPISEVILLEERPGRRVDPRQAD